MKLGVMQPYFAPYIGYWQLLNAVDTYILYDDVNFIKGGWINRNRIMVNGEVKYFNVPMKGASPNKRINEISVNKDRTIIAKNLRVIDAAYKKSPYFEEVRSLIEEIFEIDEDNLAKFVTNSIRVFCNYMQISTKIVLSSDVDKCKADTPEKQLISLCKMFNADEYYNAIGGQDLYSFDHFKENDIRLCFLKSKEFSYNQLCNDFVPNLSVIDILMNNSIEQLHFFLDEYVLISK